MNITIYVNRQNEDLFRAETEKSKLINNLLERHYFDTVGGGKTQENVRAEIKVKQEAVRVADPLPTMALACCLLKTPCRHWQYNDTNSEWVNTRTGETMSVE